MTSHQDIRILHLVEAPKLTPLLVQWFIEEWTPWYGTEGPGDAASDLAACSSRDALPICLVAVNGNGDPLGTAALKSESVGAEIGVGPWLAAVLVTETHQGQGVGTTLVQAIEEEAARLGFEAIYTSTDTAMGILERRGWREFGTTESLRGALKIYRCAIRREAAGSGPQ